jgi:hypothetical protein
MPARAYQRYAPTIFLCVMFLVVVRSGRRTASPLQSFCLSCFCPSLRPRAFASLRYAFIVGFSSVSLSLCVSVVGFCPLLLSFALTRYSELGTRNFTHTGSPARRSRTTPPPPPAAPPRRAAPRQCPRQRRLPYGSHPSPTTPATNARAPA